MEDIQQGIHDYLLELIPQRNEILTEMESYAEKEEFPIVGPLVGQFLMQYAYLIQPKRIFELGSGFGYSIMWFALASGDETEIHWTDHSNENAIIAKEYFKRANIKNPIYFHVGEALVNLKNTTGNFDIIFCDIAKEGYPEAFRQVIPRLNKGGVLITDNTLWSGRVLEDPPEEDSTVGVIEFNKLAFSD
ncbi:MAG: O-methyltransferase, partial [Candidatus Hodarchaeales archaeon]